MVDLNLQQTYWVTGQDASSGMPLSPQFHFICFILPSHPVELINDFLIWNIFKLCVGIMACGRKTKFAKFNPELVRNLPLKKVVEA